jgi:hypothetical protein
MTCEEFQRVLPELGSGHGIGQEEHLKSCRGCSNLVADLNTISREARVLQGSEEPSPWVWKSIEVALRQEGLIQPQLSHSRTPTLVLDWRLRWLVPLAATLLIVFGALIYQRGTGQPQTAQQPSPPAGVVTATLQPSDVMGGEDLQLLKTVGERMPSMRDTYEADLRSVNAYIRDAEQSAHSNPNDEVAQQYLQNAYEQKAMVYEMALDRSLP